MKAVVILPVIALVVGGVLYFQDEQTKREQARTILDMQTQLATFSNRAAAVDVEIAALRSRLHLPGGPDKARAASPTQELRGATEKDLAEEKARIALVEGEQARTATKLTSVTADLSRVKRELADLQTTHAATEAEVAALNAKKDALELERASLERRLNDLDELRYQIRLIKRRLWEQHIADWKRRDAQEGLTGNGGMLMKNGQWMK